MRIVLQLLSQILIVTACWAAQPGITKQANTAVEPKDEFLDLGNGRIHFRVSPGASPVILLEAAADGDASQWSKLQPQIAEVTGLAVVSYDRPGFGKSDLPPAAYDPALEMQQLRDALARLGFRGAVVLVGHSYGALLNQYYAHSWPQEVRGAILIEPATVGIFDSFGGAKALPPEPKYDGPVPAPKRVQAQKRFFAGYVGAIEKFRAAPWPDIPMLIVTAGNQWWPTEEQNKLWRAGHEALVAGNSKRSIVVAEGSGHIVTADRPDIVLSVIKDFAAKKSR